MKINYTDFLHICVFNFQFLGLTQSFLLVVNTEQLNMTLKWSCLYISRLSKYIIFYLSTSLMCNITNKLFKQVNTQQSDAYTALFTFWQVYWIFRPFSFASSRSSVSHLRNSGFGQDGRTRFRPSRTGSEAGIPLDLTGEK